MSETYVRLLERGLNVPTLTVVIELATVLGIEPADLVREVTSGVP